MKLAPRSSVFAHKCLFNCSLLVLFYTEAVAVSQYSRGSKQRDLYNQNTVFSEHLPGTLLLPIDGHLPSSQISYKAGNVL